MLQAELSTFLISILFSIFFYRSLIKKIGNYNPLYSGAEDYDLYFRAIATNHKISNVPKTLIRLRETENSITRGTQWRKNKLMTWKVKKNAFMNLGFHKSRDFFYFSLTPLTLLLPPKKVSFLPHSH